jgi:glycosyltransferase involved in cell wall biosynthesis
MRQKIVMIGTSNTTKGGISAVILVYEEIGLLDGVSVRYIPTHCDGSAVTKFFAAFKGLMRYLPLLVTGQVGLLHVHSASGPSFWRKFMFIAPALLAGRPVVLHWHGGGFVGFYRRSPAWQKQLIAWTFARCSRVVALSNQWHDTLTTLFPRARVVTIPNPVKLAERPAGRPAVPPILLFLGRIVAEKGVEDLLRAMPVVLEQVPDCHLVMAGTGDLQRYRELAARLGVGHAVEFPGYVEGAAKAELFSQASAFVLPSHIEAMPMSVLEAMAQGLPVVATTVGGIPQAVRNGVDGLLFEPRDVAALGDALVRLLSDEALRSNLAAAARLRVEQHFSADLIVPRIRQVWREVLAEHGDMEPV